MLRSLLAAALAVLVLAGAPARADLFADLAGGASPGGPPGGVDPTRFDGLIAELDAALVALFSRAVRQRREASKFWVPLPVLMEGAQLVREVQNPSLRDRVLQFSTRVDFDAGVRAAGEVSALARSCRDELARMVLALGTPGDWETYEVVALRALRFGELARLARGTSLDWDSWAPFDEVDRYIVRDEDMPFPDPYGGCALPGATRPSWPSRLEHGYYPARDRGEGGLALPPWPGRAPPGVVKRLMDAAEEDLAAAARLREELAAGVTPGRFDAGFLRYPEPADFLRARDRAFEFRRRLTGARAALLTAEIALAPARCSSDPATLDARFERLFHAHGELREWSARRRFGTRRMPGVGSAFYLD